MSSPGKKQQEQIDARIKTACGPPPIPPPIFNRKEAEAAPNRTGEKSTGKKLVEEKLIHEKSSTVTSTPESKTRGADKGLEKVPTDFAPVHYGAAAQIKKSKDILGQLKLDEQQKVNVAVPRERVPRSAPPLDVRPLVLATHLVPSLPVGLFELVAEAVEAATQLPVTVLYEPRAERPVAKDVTDLAILPAYSEWEDGDFLPVTFVFAHRLNDDESGNVYVDVIVAADRAPHVKDIMDLRGHRCAFPDRRQRRGAATLLLGDLRTKGEGPAFFGNTLDAGSQIAALQMVAGRQAEVGVVEAPVIACHRRKMPGVHSLLTLGSLGPLPPYAIYVKKSISGELRDKISSYLLNMKNDEDWVERFSQYGVIGFTTNSLDAYVIDEDEKEVATSVRYY